ncbi:prephenate dehydrogenase [Candidatus Omnitrophota bacterium]
MKVFKKIAIVGVGLIGGSIGLAVKKKKLAGKVIGVSRRESSRKKSIKFKAVDIATLDMKKGLADADLVVIAAPVGKIPILAKLCVKFMKKGATLTDVGSTKVEIVRKLEGIAGKKVNFVGSHPMAGSDKQGVINASADIFKGAAVIVTKTKRTNPGSARRLKRFWQKLGAHVFTLSPEKHDSFVSLASYLPHLVSFTLSRSQTKDSTVLAGGSLRDTTRVSSSDAGLWTDIFLSARGETLKSIRGFTKNLKALEKAISKKDAKSVKTFLERAKRARDKIRNA